MATENKIARERESGGMLNVIWLRAMRHMQKNKKNGESELEDFLLLLHEMF